MHPPMVRETLGTSNAAGTLTSDVDTGTTVAELNPGLALTVVPPGSVSCPCPPAALALKKLGPQVIVLLGVRPLMTVVRSRFGNRSPPVAATALNTAPGAGNSQHAFELALAIATLVTRVCGLVVVMITYTWLSLEMHRSTEIARVVAGATRATAETARRLATPAFSRTRTETITPPISMLWLRCPPSDEALTPPGLQECSAALEARE